jgi:antitoxin Phd
MKEWQSQHAKQHFSEVVRKAQKEGPQKITHRGEECAWVISSKDYRKMKKRKGTLVEFFQNSPHRDMDLKIERRKDLPRKVDL